MLVDNVVNLALSIIMIRKKDIDESTNIVDLNVIRNDDMAKGILKNFLEKEGISQAELARGIDKDKVTVNRWVNNIRDISVDDAEKVSDEKSVEIAFDVARQIEKELQYPGQIKVIVVKLIKNNFNNHIKNNNNNNDKV